MVVDESHCPLWHPPNKSCRFTSYILEAPVLAITYCLLQDAFGCEVKGGASFTGGIDPIDRVLTMLVLIVREAIMVILHVTPQLAHSPCRFTFPTVETHKLRCITLHKVK